MGMFRWRRHRSGSSDGRASQTAINPKEGNAGETAIATLKVVLRVVNEVSDGFGPLKSVVSGLEFILKNVEDVGDNTAAMQMLLRRVKKVSELTKRTDWDGEDEIHTQLTRDLDTVKQGLDPLVHQNLMERFVKSAQNAALIREYIDNVEQILCDYQVCVTQDLHRLAFEQIGYDERNALDKLTRAKDAGFDASNHRSRCLAGTRVEVLSSIQRWAKDPDAHQVYWLNGHAGSGKTTIAQSVAERLSVLGELGASFFCSRDSQQQSDLKMIFPTLAFQLALANTTDSTQYRRALLRILESNPDIARSSLNNQLEELIIGPAQSSGMTTVVLIDALDECRDPNTTSIILDLLASSIVRVPSIRFLITGRPEPHILAGFRLPQLKPVTDIMILHEIDATSVNADIRLFLQNKLTKIAEDRRRDYGSNIPSNWPKDSALDGLMKKAAGLFIFASTVVKFIESTYHDPRDQLQKVLDNAGASKYEGSFGIDDLYFNILDGAAPRHDDEFLEKLRSILGLLAITNDALLPSTIAKLLGVPRASDIRIILSSLRSLLVVPDDWSLPVCFHHQSFPDFLTDPSRCKDPRFLVNRDDHHFAIGQRCLKILRQRLKKNVCNLPRYTMNESIDVAVRDKLVDDATRYCCRYWADHLLSDVQREQHLPIIAPLLFHFLTNQQLQWFEALGLLQELGRAVESLSNMRVWMSACDTKYRVLLDWIIDGQRFVLYAFDIISLSVAHIYHSALPFAPTNSLLKKRHAVGSFPEAKVEIGIVASWSRSLRTIQIPTVAHALEYSRNGNMLAAGGNTVCRIFRSASGQNMMDLNSPGTIQSLSFSADDSLIATASNDHLRVWDVRTGAIVTELLHNDASLQLVEFHPVLKHLLLSKASEGTVRLWDVKARRCLHTFEHLAPAFGQSSGCKSLCWLKRGTKQTIAIAHNLHAELRDLSAESPCRIRIFAYPQSIHIQFPTVVSSDNGSSVALSSKTGSLIVYNIKSGALVHCISTEYTSESMHSLRLLLPAKGYVFASSRNIYNLYHTQSSRRRVMTFQGHTDDVVSVASSPDGKFIASGSRDKTIRIWEAECTNGQGSSDAHAGCHSQAIEFAHFSIDGSFVASLSLDGTISVWDTGNASCRCILPPLSSPSSTGRGRRYRAAAVLPGNEYIATVESTGEGKIWDFIGREVAGWSMPDLGGFEKIDSTSITPWGHDGLCGFFHSASIRSRSSSSKKGSYRTRIDCWTIQHVTSAEQLLRVVLTARGEIPHHATHFHHTRDHQGSTTLILQDENDHQFKAILWDYTLFTGSCRKLEFVQDMLPPDGCHIAGEQHNHSTSPEEPCRKLVDHNTSWILDDLGRRILWIPPDHDGPGKWQRDKLLLEGRSGRLTVVDFSQAKLHNNSDNTF